MLQRFKRQAVRSAFPWRQHGAGAVVATAVLAALLVLHPPAGEKVVPNLSTARFAVAVLAGPKQAEQAAPADADQKVPAVAPTPEPKSNTAAVAERKNSLPDAVAAAQESTPGSEVAKPAEVIPPAQVSMPGGQLMAEDAPAGEHSDPFVVGPRQVYLRLFVNEKGKVVRGGIVRSGGEPMRDAFILKAISSRLYATKNLMRIEGSEPVWQMDLVIDYGTNEMVP